MTILIIFIMTSFIISSAIIEVPAAMISGHDANAAGNDDSSCRNHTSGSSKKCSKYDTPLILPFP
jgi:hypothetical protein